MADYYAVGATGNWQGGTVWATSSGGTATTATPLATDNVWFDSNSTGTITVGTTSTCLNMTIASGGAFTITMGSTAVLTIAGSLSDDGTGTWSPNTTSNLKFSGTSSGLTFSSTRTFGIVTFNGVGGIWTLGSNLTSVAGSGSSIIVYAGTLLCSTYTLICTAGSAIQISGASSFVTCSSMSARIVEVSASATLTIPVGASYSSPSTIFAIEWSFSTGKIIFGGIPSVTLGVLTVAAAGGMLFRQTLEGN